MLAAPPTRVATRPSLCLCLGALLCPLDSLLEAEHPSLGAESTYMTPEVLFQVRPLGHPLSIAGVELRGAQCVVITIVGTSVSLRAGMMTDSCATKRRQNTPLVALSNTCVSSTIFSFPSQKFQFASCDSSQSSPRMTAWICSETSPSMVIVLPPSSALTMTVPMTIFLLHLLPTVQCRFLAIGIPSPPALGTR